MAKYISGFRSSIDCISSRGWATAESCGKGNPSCWYKRRL